MDPHRSPYTSPYRGGQWPSPCSSLVYSPPAIYGGSSVYSSPASGPSGGSYSSRSFSARHVVASPPSQRRRYLDDVSESSGAVYSSTSPSYGLNRAQSKGRDVCSPANSVSEHSSKLTRRIDKFLRSSEQTVDRITGRTAASTAGRMRRSRPESPDLSLSISGRAFRSSSAASISIKAGKHLDALNSNPKLKPGVSTASDSVDNLDSDSDEDLDDISDDTSADLSKFDDLSSDSDDEFFDVPLGNRAPAPKVDSIPVNGSAVDKNTEQSAAQKRSHNQSVPAINHLGQSNKPHLTEEVVSPPSAVQQTLPSTTTAASVANKAEAKPTTLAPVMAERVATPLASHKKYPAPQPPGSLSRQASSASLARNSLIVAADAAPCPGSLSRQVSSASIARTSLHATDAAAAPQGTPGAGKKCQRAASFKKYPAPPPPGVSRQGSMASIASLMSSADKTAVPNNNPFENDSEKSAIALNSVTNMTKKTKTEHSVNGISDDMSNKTMLSKTNEANVDPVSNNVKHNKINKTENLKINGHLESSKIADVNGVLTNGLIEDTLSVTTEKSNTKLKETLNSANPKNKDSESVSKLANGSMNGFKHQSSKNAKCNGVADPDSKDHKVQKKILNIGKRSTSRDVSVESSSTDDDHSRRSMSRDTNSKKSVSGKLAALANKFESVNTTKVESQKDSPKSPTDIKTRKLGAKLPKNKLGSLASKFEAIESSKADIKDKSVLSGIGKVQSPYSKPFDPEPNVPKLSGRKSIGGINISRFGGTGKFPTVGQLRKTSKAGLSDDEKCTDAKVDKSPNDGKQPVKEGSNQPQLEGVPSTSNVTSLPAENSTHSSEDIAIVNTDNDTTTILNIDADRHENLDIKQLIVTEQKSSEDSSTVSVSPELKEIVQPSVVGAAPASDTSGNKLLENGDLADSRLLEELQISPNSVLAVTPIKSEVIYTPVNIEVPKPDAPANSEPLSLVVNTTCITTLPDTITTHEDDDHAVFKQNSVSLESKDVGKITESPSVESKPESIVSENKKDHKSTDLPSSNCKQESLLSESKDVPEVTESISVDSNKCALPSNENEKIKESIIIGAKEDSTVSDNKIIFETEELKPVKTNLEVPKTIASDIVNQNVCSISNTIAISDEQHSSIVATTTVPTITSKDEAALLVISPIHNASHACSQLDIKIVPSTSTIVLESSPVIDVLSIKSPCLDSIELKYKSSTLVSCVKDESTPGISVAAALQPLQKYSLVDTAIATNILSSSSSQDYLTSSTISRHFAPIKIPSPIFTRASSVSPTISTNFLKAPGASLNGSHFDSTFRARSLTPLEEINGRLSVRPKTTRLMTFEARMAAITSETEEPGKSETALEKYRRRKQMRNSATKSKLDALLNEQKSNVSLSDASNANSNVTGTTVPTSTETPAYEGLKFKIDLSSIKDFLKKTEEEISKLPRYIREPWSMARGSEKSTAKESSLIPVDSQTCRYSSPILGYAKESSSNQYRLSSLTRDRSCSPEGRSASLCIDSSSQRLKHSPRSSDGDDDVYLDANDAIDTSQMDTLMPLMSIERRCRSVTPSRVLVNTEKMLSQTDRILRKSRSGNSLRKSYSRSLCAANVERLSEVVADLAEEHSTAQLAGERLEAEQADRMRLEKDLDNAQHGMRELSVATDRLENEKTALRAEMLQHASCLNNGDTLDLDEAGSASLYKRKFEWSQREVESLKQQLRQQQQDEQEQSMLLKKQLEKKVSDAREEAEEQRQVAAQLKKRTQRLQAEMNDLKILLEEQAARNTLLEKKQRKFDSDLAAGQDELRVERLNKEKVVRERDAHLAEKYAVDQEVSTLKLELELKEERVVALSKQLEELSVSGQGDHELTQLRKAKLDMQNKTKDQEEELDELAGQVQMLEASRTRLEMSIEQTRKENKRELQQRDEEVEEVRCSAQKKAKALEAQVEAEHEERTLLVREKHELERRLMEHMDRSSVAPDDDTVHRLKKDLRKTKALLKDTQTMLEKNQSEGPSKLIIRQLKTQLEDCEFAKTAALKARQSCDADLCEVQSALEDVQRARKEAEDRASRLLKEKTELQTQLDDGEELHAETLKKYKSTVSQISVDQITLSEQTQRVAELEQEKQVLSDRLTELSSKVEVLEGETANIHTQRMLQMKVKELDSKLELELATRKRIEGQVVRLKEQVERVGGECDLSKLKEAQSIDQSKKLNRQLRQTKEETAMLQQRNTELGSKKQELEKQMELMDSEITTLKSDLKLAFKRIEDLQMALQGDISDSDSDLSDSDSDSDTSLTSYLTSSVRGSRSTASAALSQPNTSPTNRGEEDLMSPGSDAMAIIEEAKEESYA